MTLGSNARKSKYGISAMDVGEVRVFDTPTDYDKKLLRSSANKQNTNTNRYYMTRSKGNTVTVTRLR